MNAYTLLFLGGAKRLSLAEHFIRRGAEKGLAVSILSYELDRFAPISRVGRVVEGLPWGDPGVVAHIEALIAREGIHTVLPFVDPAVALAARLAERTPALFMPVCSRGVAERFFDKRLADAWFRRIGIPTPPADDSLPAIAKPRTGSASKGLLLLRTAAEREAFRNRPDADDFVVQRHIDGPEFTVDAYVGRGGRVLCAVPRRRLEITSGESTRTITVRHPEIERMSAAILGHPGFRGPVTVQFIADRATGTSYAMEINPRFGGGAPCSIHAGADSVAMMIDEFLGREPEPAPDWEEGFVMARAFQEVYFHADRR